MSIWIGVFLGVIAVFHLLRGRVDVTEGDRYTTRARSQIGRAEQPLIYWSIVAVEAAAAALMLFGVIRF
jgi:hypothetical protein